MLSLDAVADVLEVDIGRLRKCIEKAPLLFFAGAKQVNGDWFIPPAALRPWLGSGRYPLLTVSDVMHALRLSRSQVSHLVATKRIGHVRLPGDKVRFRPADIAAALRTIAPRPIFLQEGTKV